jgi:hypothetical protein
MIYFRERGDALTPPSRIGSKSPRWRVAILPRLGHQALYERFHLVPSDSSEPASNPIPSGRFSPLTVAK